MVFLIWDYGNQVGQPSDIEADFQEKQIIGEHGTLNVQE